MKRVRLPANPKPRKIRGNNPILTDPNGKDSGELAEFIARDRRKKENIMLTKQSGELVEKYSNYSAMVEPLTRKMTTTSNLFKENLKTQTVIYDTSFNEPTIVMQTPDPGALSRQKLDELDPYNHNSVVIIL